MSMRIETQMNDMLENFRLYGGIQLSMIDWKSGDVFAEAIYLPKRIDYGIRFDRKSINWVNDGDATQPRSRTERYVFQKVELSFSLPLITRLRVSVKPFVGLTQYMDKGSENPNSN